MLHYFNKAGTTKGITVLSFSLFFIYSFNSFGQKKKLTTNQIIKEQPIKIISYEVLENGDTINKVDQNAMKHGKWLLYSKNEYNEQPLFEFGVYDYSKRVGKWMVYDKQGSILAEENYKQGLKDGEAKYFENGNLYCVGNYLALRSKYEYDTIMVENPITNLTRPVVVKASIGSVRHGMWTFYNLQTKKVDRVVEYQVDEIIYDKDYTENQALDSAATAEKLKTMPHISNKLPVNSWKIDKDKKPNKYTEFPDNMQYVKPNVRREKNNKKDNK